MKYAYITVLLALLGAAAHAHAQPWGSGWRRELRATVAWGNGSANVQTCDSHVVRIEGAGGYDAVCELHIDGPCALTLRECLTSYDYVGESEEPADTLGCEATQHPRVLVVDCLDVEGVAP